MCVDNPRRKIKKPPTSGGSNTTIDTRRHYSCQRMALNAAAPRAGWPTPQPCGCIGPVQTGISDISPVANRSVARPQRVPVNTPNSKRLACRRDSACCNFSLLGHEMWRRLAPLVRLCIGSNRAF
jgi:hypothetical protein